MAVDGNQTTVPAPPVREVVGWKERLLAPSGYLLSIAGSVCVGLAYLVAAGVFTPGCGSPFLFRYIGVNGDPMATQFYSCLLASPGYRLLTFVLAGVGLGLLVAALFTTRGNTTSLARVVRWASLVVAGCGSLLVLGGGLAVAQVVN